MFSGNAEGGGEVRVTAKMVSETWEQSMTFTSGTGVVVYEANLLVQPKNGAVHVVELASKVTVGSVGIAIALQ